MSAASDVGSQRVAEAHRWRRRVGARVIETEYACIVFDPDKPSVGDGNYADSVSARTPAEIEAVFAAMNLHLAHTRWRVVHTDGSTPDPFLAQLAFETYRERLPIIQMALYGEASVRGADLRSVETEQDWSALAKLALDNRVEGLAAVTPETGAVMVEGLRAKSPFCRYYLVVGEDAPIGYGACAAAPNGLGLIEDVFVGSLYRRRGVAGATISALVAQLRAQGCDGVFIGALSEEPSKRLYARLGFRPVALARTWVKHLS